jgi:hypothetical protein
VVIRHTPALPTSAYSGARLAWRDPLFTQLFLSPREHVRTIAGELLTKLRALVKTMTLNPSRGDAGHLSFLELIRSLGGVAGAPFASGALIKTGLGIGKATQPVSYPDMAAFVAAIEAESNPISDFEGNAKHYGNGVFGLPVCPFAASVKSYLNHAGGLPAEYAAITESFNKASPTTEKLRIGHGAGVSPFCGVHQTLRSTVADHVLIGGKPAVVYQLGCKSGSGKKGMADQFIEATGIERSLVEQVLDENMCCYVVRTE